MEIPGRSCPLHYRYSPSTFNRLPELHADTIVNNGAAGMPNLKGTTFGLITRIATQPTPHPSLFGIRVRDVYVGLLKVEYDQPSWLELFQQNWPPASPAHSSYFDRIVNGPHFSGPISV